MGHKCYIKFKFLYFSPRKASKYSKFMQFTELKKTNALKNKILMSQNMIKQLLTHF